MVSAAPTLAIPADAAVDDFPSSSAFDLISQSLADESERNVAIKQAGAIFAFTLKNAQGKVDSWHIDLKNTGAVGKGLAPEGAKPNSTFLPLLRPLLRGIINELTWIPFPSNAATLRQRLPEHDRGQGKCATNVHVRKAEDQG